MKKRNGNKVDNQTERVCSLWPWAVHWQRGTGVHAAWYRLSGIKQRLGSSNNCWGSVGCTLGHSRLLPGLGLCLWVCTLSENRQHGAALSQTSVLAFTSHCGSLTPSLQYITSKCDATRFWRGHYMVQVYVCFFRHDASTTHELSVPVCHMKHPFWSPSTVTEPHHQTL